METEKETKSALKESEKIRPVVHNGKKRPIVQCPALESLNSGRRPTTAAPQDEQQRKVEGGRDEREKMSKPKQLISKLIFFVFFFQRNYKKESKENERKAEHLSHS